MFVTYDNDAITTQEVNNMATTTTRFDISLVARFDGADMQVFHLACRSRHRGRDVHTCTVVVEASGTDTIINAGIVREMRPELNVLDAAIAEFVESIA